LIEIFNNIFIRVGNPAKNVNLLGESENGNSTCNCLPDINLVCGGDNKTYGNDCLRKCAGVSYR